jgi:hypothetical protein
MKEIQPVTLWVNGQSVQANYFSMFSIKDDLSSSAIFSYQLLNVMTDQDGNISSSQLTQGNLTMDGTDYENWGNAGNINNEAYVWATQQLNLTLV